MYEISKIIMGMDFYGNGLLMGKIGTFKAESAIDVGQIIHVHNERIKFHTLF